MIKFFRGIRQKLLKENNFGKYLIYAIGEIFLVVIGILIALAANDYTEQKKALNQSSIYLHDMLEDLASDTSLLGNMLLKLDSQLNVERWLLDKKTFEKEDIDSIKIAVSNINWTFNITDRSFQNIQHSAETKLVGFEHLYSDISKYYFTTKNRIAQNNELERQNIRNKSTFEQIVHKNILITSRQYDDYSGVRVNLDISSSFPGGNLEKIISSLSEIETQNALHEKYARHSFIYVALFFCREEAKQLIENIQSSLQKE